VARDHEGSIMGFLDILLDRQKPAGFHLEATAYDPNTIVRLTDGVYDLLYNRSYQERCQRDGQAACSAWLHAQMDELGVAHTQHERLIILAKFRNGDRSFRDLPKA
jgi:hypothetical protein